MSNCVHLSLKVNHSIIWFNKSADVVDQAWSINLNICLLAVFTDCKLLLIKSKYRKRLQNKFFCNMFFEFGTCTFYLVGFMGRNNRWKYFWSILYSWKDLRSCFPHLCFLDSSNLTLFEYQNILAFNFCKNLY